MPATRWMPVRCCCLKSMAFLSWSRSSPSGWPRFAANMGQPRSGWRATKPIARRSGRGGRARSRPWAGCRPTSTSWTVSFREPSCRRHWHGLTRSAPAPDSKSATSFMPVMGTSIRSCCSMPSCRGSMKRCSRSAMRSSNSALTPAARLQVSTALGSKSARTFGMSFRMMTSASCSGFAACSIRTA